MGRERSDTHRQTKRVMDGEIESSVYRKLLNRLTHLPIYATVGSVDEIMCSTEPSHVDRRGLFKILEISNNPFTTPGFDEITPIEISPQFPSDTTVSLSISKTLHHFS
jgi:hypothetical protein